MSLSCYHHVRIKMIRNNSSSKASLIQCVYVILIHLWVSRIGYNNREGLVVVVYSVNPGISEVSTREGCSFHVTSAPDTTVVCHRMRTNSMTVGWRTFAALNLFQRYTNCESATRSNNTPYKHEEVSYPILSCPIISYTLVPYTKVVRWISMPFMRSIS